jgi:hypothetical protein
MVKPASFSIQAMRAPKYCPEISFRNRSPEGKPAKSRTYPNAERMSARIPSGLLGLMSMN